MPATSPEVERDIAQRAERRRQELMEALSGNIFSHIQPQTSEDVRSPSTDMKREFPAGKENQSPKSEVLSHLLYPSRPARSVYNSPLIKTNRPPLWKTPPHSTSCELLNSNRVKILSKQGDDISITGHPLQNREKEALGKTPPWTAKYLNRPLSYKGNRLYPSLPKTNLNDSVVSSKEAKDLKDHSNRNTASAQRQRDHSNLIQQMPDQSQQEIKRSSQVRDSIEDESSSKNYETGHKVHPGIVRNDSLEEEGLYSSDTDSENDFEDTYEMDKFLEDALGSVLDIPSNDANVKDIDNSFLSLDSYCTPDKTNTSTLQSSMRLVKSKVKSMGKPESVAYLLKEAEKQQQVMEQASKALNVCRSSKAFSNSLSLVDAERLLLLATLRHKAVLDQIRGVPPSISQNNEGIRGQLRIVEVSAPLKSCALKANKNENLINIWFLCILSYGQQILASDAVAYEAGAKCITFSGVMELSNLPSSFIASLQIYTLRTFLPSGLVHKSKISKACNLLRRQSKSCLGPSTSSEQFLHMRTPAFALCGSVQLNLSNIQSSSQNTFCLEKVPLMSLLQGTLWVRIETSLTTCLELSGFLTVLEKAGDSYAWQRRWCHLSKLSLCFWSYPTDQDVKEPQLVIDLRCCSSEEIMQAPRHLCPRNRTLMLKVIRSCGPNDMNSTILECDGDITIERYFLACDTASEMTEWANILNQVVSSIKAWNVTS